jgi:phage-related protein
VNEIRIDSQDGWFRVMYVAKFEEVIYVLHSFQKKTRKTSRNDIEIARARYRAVVAERKTAK